MKQAREIVETERDSRMILPKARRANRQRAAIEWLGLSETIRSVEQVSEIIEAYRHIWMVRPEARFVDRQRAAKLRLSLARAVRVL